MNYIEFLQSKIKTAPESGFEVSESEVNPILKPHERDSALWMIRGGQRALFSSFGLGKTITQLEVCRIITGHEEGKALIIAPLGVVHVFQDDADRLLQLNVRYIKTMAEAMVSDERILVTNYERVRDGDIDPAYFTVVSLDEASVLRSYGSKTYQEFLIKFQSVKYRFVATATPSPNRYKELIHYAGFLGIMDTGQALTRFFHRDSTRANNLTLYPHKEKEFWYWVSTWALFITKPSDLGYSDEGYDLPPMKVIYHVVQADHSTAGKENDGQLKLFRNASLGLRDVAAEKRDSLPLRIEKMLEIIMASPKDHFIIWHDLEAERHAIKKSLPEAAEIYGSQDIEKNTELSRAFEQGKLKYLATKPNISGTGNNYQYHCHKAIFLGIGYKFHDFIQAIYRIYRFMQNSICEIHIVYAESEQAILNTLKQKWNQHNELVQKMPEIIRENGLSSTNAQEKLTRSIGVQREVITGTAYTAVYNDNVLELPRLGDNSVDLIHTSIPFSNHYEYTPSYNDFGHNEDNARFFEQMDYLTPELLRVLKPGRVAAVHVKDRILFGNATGTGMSTVDPFSDLTTAHFIRHGFQFMGRITVVTDVVRENNQTYRLGWSEQCKDGSKMGVGCPEYILLFRKLPSDTSKAYADTPVTKSKAEYTRARWQLDAHAFWRSSGDRLALIDELKNTPVSDLQARYREYSRTTVYSYDEHVALADDLEDENKLPASFMVLSPGSHTEWVWDDVNRMRTLNSEQARKELQMHICPLQFDIVERIIRRYSNPGELVLDPFGGLMTVPYMAVKMGRKGYGIELNYLSFKDGCRYLKDIEMEVTAPTLFDLTECVIV
ncbi:MAG: DNA methylase N-4 [Treponema sp.]|jgi:DNA modification methylase|nr:DNA methylase N-4 [Treponema sp.]